jgi:hypothetical protein
MTTTLTGQPARFVAQTQDYADQPKAAFNRDDMNALDPAHVGELDTRANSLAGFKRMISRAIAAAKTGVGTTGSERLACVQPSTGKPAASPASSAT